MTKKTSEAVIAAASEPTAAGVLSAANETVSPIVWENAPAVEATIEARVEALEARLAYLTAIFGWPKD